MAQQDVQEVAELIRSLEVGAKGSKSKGRKSFSCKKSTFPVAGSDDVSVDSWRFQDWDYKRDDLPTYARGLFTTRTKENRPEIAIRGYDKFFNVEEVNDTKWQNIENNTRGPYELSVKENGCIIFMSGLEDGTLLVCSKHSTGYRQDTDVSHAIAGERWVKKHVASVGKTTTDLAQELRRLNVTAVGELCDDNFEEHVLAYDENMAGLYLHGINFNLPVFATLPGPEVHKFADAWGFKKAQFIMKEDIQEVKEFLDKCAESGSWEGRDTEGFVIRCQMREERRDPYRDWFFKYKFEEPYLMYRQWREATKSIISGKPPRYKKHKKITEEYLLYARRQLTRNPKLGKEYNQNHGIIAMRDGFLNERGVTGSDIIAHELAEENGSAPNEVTRNVVLLPIASIGCGKTTIAVALVHLFNWGHIQNDNIQGQKNRPKRFAIELCNSLAEYPVVIADRNNHQRRERKQIMDDVNPVVPDVRFVALHYVHEPKDRLLPEIRKVTRKRVLDRGDNHQTIHAGTKGPEQIVGIMEGFLNRFEGINTNTDPDHNFDEVINLDPTASSLENLEIVIFALHNAYPKLFSGEMPTPQDLQDAIDAAMTDYAVTDDSKHDLSRNNNTKGKSRDKPMFGQRNNHSAPDPFPLQPLTPDQLVKRIEYFSITLPTPQISSTLTSLFPKTTDSKTARLYNHLSQSRRIQPSFHVTLIHRAASKDHPEIWKRYTDLYVSTLQRQQPQPNGDQSPPLGPARIRLERLVWDDRIMCFVARILPPEPHQGDLGLGNVATDGGGGGGGEIWPCAYDIAHITVGTASPDVKPKESNVLLRRWLDGSGEGESEGIWEKEVQGVKVLEGVVRPVLMRGK